MGGAIGRLYLRLIVLSFIILAFGVVITVYGVKYTCIYYSTPANGYEINNNFKNNKHVILSNYVNEGDMDLLGYTYYLIKYTDDDYIVVETQKNGFLSHKLSDQIGVDETYNTFAINGYLRKMDDITYESICNELKDAGYDSGVIDNIANFKICYLKGSEITSIIFGSSLILVSISCLIALRWLIKKRRDWTSKGMY